VLLPLQLIFLAKAIESLKGGDMTTSAVAVHPNASVAVKVYVAALFT
jgi:hypothetical protein